MRRLLPAEQWRRNQWVMTAVVFVVFTGFAFVLPFLPLFVVELGVKEPHRAAWWAGLLIGVAPLLAGLLAPVWGRLADRHGQRPMAIRALVSYVVLLVLSAAVTSVEQLFALRAGIGLFGGIGPLGLAMATAHAPREHTGRVVGSIQSAQILSAAVGPLAGGLLADTIGIRPTFLVTAAACAIALVMLVLYYDESGPLAPREDAVKVPFLAILGLPRVGALLVVLFLVNFVGRSFTPVLPMHLEALGIPDGRVAFTTGALIAAYSIAAAASASALGHATRERSPRALLAASLFLGALLVVPMALVARVAPFVVLAILLGLASGGELTLCYTMGGLLVPADRRTTAFGFFSAAALFGGAVAPAVAGLLSRWDLRTIYYVDGALFLGLALALLVPSGDRGTGAPSAAAGPRRA